MVFNKEFSRNVDSKRSEDVGVKRGWLVWVWTRLLSMVVGWMQALVRPTVGKSTFDFFLGGGIVCVLEDEDGTFLFSLWDANSTEAFTHENM